METTLEEIFDFEEYNEYLNYVHLQCIEKRRNYALQDSNSSPLCSIFSNSLTRCQTVLKNTLCWLFIFFSTTVLLALAFHSEELVNIEQDGCGASLSNDRFFIHACPDEGIRLQNVTICGGDEQQFQVLQVAESWEAQPGAMNYMVDNSEWSLLCADTKRQATLAFVSFLLNLLFTCSTFCILTSALCPNFRCLAKISLYGASFPPLWAGFVIALYFTDLIFLMVWCASMRRVRHDILLIFNDLLPSSITNSTRTNLYYGVIIYMWSLLILVALCAFIDIFHGNAFQVAGQVFFDKDWKSEPVLVDMRIRFASFDSASISRASIHRRSISFSTSGFE